MRALAGACETFAVSLEPDQAARKAEDGDAPGLWVELLVNGLTFDLVGLAPGPPSSIPPVAHRLGAVGDIAKARLEALTLQPGPHLVGGGTMLPVVRSLAWLTARLTELAECTAVAWHPARCVGDPQPFREDVLHWSEGGVFPSLSLIGLTTEPDGALLSEGFHLFVGQELRIEPELAADRDAATSLAAQLLHRLAEHGRLEVAERAIAPDGAALRLEPSANKRFVRVWKAG